MNQTCTPYRQLAGTQREAVFGPTGGSAPGNFADGGSIFGATNVKEITWPA